MEFAPNPSLTVLHSMHFALLLKPCFMYISGAKRLFTPFVQFLCSRVVGTGLFWRSYLFFVHIFFLVVGSSSRSDIRRWPALCLSCYPVLLHVSATQHCTSCMHTSHAFK